MLVIAQHTNINDPKTFWEKAQSIVGNLPSGMKVQSVFPSQDGKTGTCIWEGNVEEIQKFLDNASEGLATNFCYEVNEAAAIGLPERKQAAALN